MCFKLILFQFLKFFLLRFLHKILKNFNFNYSRGKFGKVYRCVEKATNLILAAKCIRLKRDADIEKVEQEVS